MDRYASSPGVWRVAISSVLLAVGLLGSLPAQRVVAASGDDLYDPASLNSVELFIDEEDWWAGLLAARETGGLLAGAMRFNGREFPGIGVRFHGRSSFSPHRHSKKVPFWIALDHAHPGQRVDGRATLILKNNYLDPSHLREVLALRLLGDYLPAPRANFVSLSINGESWGVYVNIELPDREMLAHWFADTSGPIHIGERPFALVSLRREPCQAIFPQVNEGAEDACSKIERLLTLAEGADPASRHEHLPALLDVDAALRHLAAETMLGHTDGFPRHNYTLYLDPQSDRFSTIPWDFNMAFRNGAMRLMRAEGILSDPTWFARYRGYVRTMIERSLIWGRIEGWIRDWNGLIGEAVRNDEKRLYPFEGFLENVTAPVVPPRAGMATPGLQPVIEGRARWLLDSGIGRTPRVSLSPVEPIREAAEGGSRVLLRAEADDQVQIERIVSHLEIDHVYSELEMRDDGTGGDEVGGDCVFTATVDLPGPDTILDYYFSAEAVGGDVNFLPYSGGFRPFRLSRNTSD